MEVKKIKENDIYDAFDECFDKVFGEDNCTLVFDKKRVEAKVSAPLNSYINVAEVNTFCKILGIDTSYCIITDSETIYILNCEVI